MKKILFISTFAISFSCNYLLADQPISPSQGQVIYTLYIKFQWNQFQSAEIYNLQVAKMGTQHPFADSLVVDVLDSNTVVIIDEGLEWGKEYIWRVRGILSDGTYSDWGQEHNFITYILPFNAWNFSISILDSNQYCPGITLFEDWENHDDPRSFGVDMEGNIVWYAPPPMRWDFNLLDSGLLFYLHEKRITLANLNNEILWQSDYDDFHHEVEFMPNGNFLSLTHDYRWVVTFGDSLVWIGDVIYEMNFNQEIVWSWNCFDYFSTVDFDSSVVANLQPGQEYDWTHGNACTYDPLEDVIYYSSRNLSRIVKINHSTGEILWTMGAKMSSGQADFGDSLFWFQHAPEPQPNGNLLIYNNNHYFLDPRYSSAMELNIDFSLPDSVEVVWEYRQSDYSLVMGDADRLPNGNTLITAGSQAYLVEVKENSEEVWRLDSDRWCFYRGERVPSLYPQVFSVKSPGLIYYINEGSGTIQYRIFNKGNHEDTYSLHLWDTNQWFEEEEHQITIQPGEYACFEPSYICQFSCLPDTLFLVAISSLNPFTIDSSMTLLTTIPSITTELQENDVKLSWNFVSEADSFCIFKSFNPLIFEEPYFYTTDTVFIDTGAVAEGRAFYRISVMGD